MLTSMEHRYTVTEQGTHGCLWAIEKFEKFLLSRHGPPQHPHQCLADSVQKINKFICWTEGLPVYDLELA